eukprot:411485-Prorocentrum_minimum.AAC.1
MYTMRNKLVEYLVEVDQMTCGYIKGSIKRSELTQALRKFFAFKCKELTGRLYLSTYTPSVLV